MPQLHHTSSSRRKPGSILIFRCSAKAKWVPAFAGTTVRGPPPLCPTRRGRTPPSGSAPPARAPGTDGPRPRPRPCSTCTVRPACHAARRSVSRNCSSLTRPVQEQVRKMPPGATACSASRFMSRYFFSAEIDLLAVARLLGRVEHHHVEALAAIGTTSRSQANRSACTKRTRAWLRLAFCFASAIDLLVEVDADHLLGAAERLGVDREAAGVAAQVEHALAARRTPPASCGCRAGRAKKPVLCLLPGRDAEAHAVLGDDVRRRRLRRRGSRTTPASARAPRRTSRTGCPGKCAPARRWIASRKRYMPAAKNSSTSVVAEAVDDQAAQPVALGMDEAVGVGDGVELRATSRRSATACADPAGEEGGVDRLVGVGGQHAQGDARVAVVEAAADPLAVAVEDVHDAARRQALRRASRPSSGRSTDATSGARS